MDLKSGATVELTKHQILPVKVLFQFKHVLVYYGN